LLIKQGMQPLIEAIEAFKTGAASGGVGRKMTAAKLMDGLPADVLAYFTFKTGLSSAVARTALTSAAMDVGAMIEEEVRLCAFEGSEPALYATILRQLKARGAQASHARKVFVFAANKANIELPSMTRTDKLHLGTKLIELLIEVTGFFDLVHRREGKTTRVILQPTEKVSQWINDRNVMAELFKPYFLPTVIPPAEWQGLTGGGYHTDALNPMPMVKRMSKPHRAALESSDITPVLRSINAIQNTGWRINTRVLDVMKEAWDRGVDGMALPNREDLDCRPSRSRWRTP
jgi:DNA-directed RNA polymerase